jgi:hypothetical protein
MSEPAPPFADAVRSWLDARLAKLPESARFRETALLHNRWIINFNRWQHDLACDRDGEFEAIERYFGPMTALRFHQILGAIDAAQDRLVKQTEPA